MASTVTRPDVLHIYAGTNRPPSEPLPFKRDLLAAVSSKFDAMFNGAFLDAEQSIVYLRSDSMDDWFSFHRWMHTNTFRSQDSIARLDTIADKYTFQKDLARAWMFGDKYDIPAYKTEIICLFASAIEGPVLEADQATALWKLTREGCPLRWHICHTILCMFRGTAPSAKWPKIAEMARLNGFSDDMQRCIRDIQAEEDALRGEES